MNINGQAVINGSGGLATINGIQQGGVLPPDAPTLLTAVQNGAGQIDLGWTDNSGNEDGFSIERSDGDNLNFVEIDTVAADVISYSDTGLGSGLYYYRVLAYNAAGDSAYSNEALGVCYALRVSFSTDDAAPLTNPYVGEVGSVVPTDVSGNLSASSGKLQIAAGATVGKVISSSFTRAVGLAALVKIASTATLGLRSGWTPDTWSNGYFAVYSSAFFVQQFGINLFVPGSGEREYLAVMQSDHVLFLSRAIAGTWRLDWVVLADSGNKVTGVLQHSATATGTADDLRVINLGGDYATDYGICTNYVENPANGETSSGTADLFIRFTLVAQAGVTQEISFRRTDVNNRWYIECNQTAGTVKLFKVNVGVVTELDAGKTQTWVSGNSYKITITADGSALRTYVNATAKHSATDAFNSSATGVVVSHVGNKLAIYPRYPSVPSV